MKESLLNLLLGTICSIIATLLLAFLKPLWRSKRHRNYILLSIFLFLIILTFYFSGFSTELITGLLFVMLVGYAVVAHRSATRPVFPETLAISKLATLVKEGRYTEIDERFFKMPFYIRSTSAKIEWDLLTAKKLMADGQQRNRDAYEIYSNLLKLSPFKKEENDIKLNQILALLLLGDTNRSKSIFDRVMPTLGGEKQYEVYLYRV